MSPTLSMTALVRPRKAAFGFKTYLTNANLMPLTGWLRDNLGEPDGTTWFFELTPEMGSCPKFTIYTNDASVAARIQALVPKVPS